MASAPLTPTNTSGICKRERARGTRYVVVHRDQDGKQPKQTARTLDKARALKRRRERGASHAAGCLTFAAYALERADGTQRATRPRRPPQAPVMLDPAVDRGEAEAR